MHLGSDVCDFCIMIISDANFAAACIVHTPDGRTHTAAFDDIGCLLAFDQANHDSIDQRYVTDYDSGDWLDATKAFYIQSPDIRSPMASGLIASATQADADRLADRFRGSVLRFDELGTHAEPGGPANTTEETAPATPTTDTEPPGADATTQEISE